MVGGVINTARQVGAAFGLLLLAIAEVASGTSGVTTVIGDRHAMVAGAATGPSPPWWPGAPAVTDRTILRRASAPGIPPQGVNRLHLSID